MEYFIAAVLGWIASWLQAKNFKSMHSIWRYLIAFGSCFLAAGLVTFISVNQGGQFDVDQFLALIGSAFVTSQTYYNTYFKLKTA